MVEHYVPEGIPFLRSLNIHPFKLAIDDVKYVTKEFHTKLRKSALAPGDVAVVRTGYPGTACVIPPSLPVANCADLVVITPSSELNPYYLAAIFNSAWGRASVAGNLVGVAQQHFNVSVAKEMAVPLPPREVQDRVMEVLSAYDELIANNQRRIAVLEQMARALYREWFVYFRAPGVVMKEGEELPEGWEVKKLGSLVENFDRLRRPLSKMKRAQIQGDYPYYGAAKVFDYVNDYIFDGEYLLLAEDGSVINPDRSPVLQLVNEKFWPNNHTHVLRGKPPISTHFLYLSLLDFDISPYITGAAQPKITQGNMNRIPVMCATIDVHAAFDRIVHPMLEHCQVLQRQTANLRRTRDLLLPRLMSGRVEVSLIQEHVEAE
jgi:type I restriction enzyme S subunit